MGKLPASLFYWGDLLRDPDVRRCTHHELGVWMRVLCLMFEAETKGVLATKGVAWSDDDIVMAIGGKYEETLCAVTSLVTKGVASRNEAGALINRRMYREEKERVDTRERVRKHRERKAAIEGCNGDGNDKDTLCTETESENATKSSSFVLKEKIVRVDAEAIYAAYPRKVGRKSALRSIEQAFTRLTSLTGEGAFKFVPEEANSFLLGMATAYARSPAGNAGEYTPHPATWFNQSRYLDDPKEWNRGGKTNGSTRTAEVFDVNASLEAKWAAEDLGIETHHSGRTIEARDAGSERASAGDAGELVLAPVD